MGWKKRKRISVRKIKEILRLKYGLGLTARQIGRSCGISHATVIKTLKRAENAGLTWPFPEYMDDSQLERKLYPNSTGYSTPKSLPDMVWIHKELKRGHFRVVGEAEQQAFQKAGRLKALVFESIDRPALKPLPPERYEFAIWKKARVNIDYHVEADHNYYSVPYQLVKEEVDLRLTAATVEALYKGRRVASHKKVYGKGIYVTDDAHRPDSHKRYLEWIPSWIISWAKTVGPNTEMMSRRIMELRPHPEQGFRSCMGFVSLSRHYSPERLEAACHRAIALGAFSYKSVKSILQNNIDGFPMGEDKQEKPLPIDHRNIRGPQYYSHGGDGTC